MARRRRRRSPHARLRQLGALGLLLLLLLVPLALINCQRATPTRPAASAAVADDEPTALLICSFNIQFLGSSTRRRNDDLAAILEPYDIVVIQELVAPPYPGAFPDGTPFRPDPEAAAFFDAMAARGFEHLLSIEDTGPGDRNQSNGTGTEWFAAFYRPGRVVPAGDLPNGFIADDRTNHPDYGRVPHAFAFRDVAERADFVLISVHLPPDATTAARARRAHELRAINDWVVAMDSTTGERDFIILGDMNIYTAEELATVTPSGFLSLNDECRPTNTTIRSARPYDHVMYRPLYTTEIDTEFDLQVVDLIEAMRPRWDTTLGPYPGDPYDHDKFRAYYSDHHPIVFRLVLPPRDDD